MQDTARKPKSERLTIHEHRLFKNFLKKQISVVAAAEIIGIHRSVVDKVCYTGKASPESIELIRKAIAA